MSERILVVDDDPQLTGLLERYLTKQGFEVVCAGTAREMARVLGGNAFDLCVLDLTLPDRDGFEITKELRRTSRLPIVVLTARTEVFDRVVGLELGADNYLTKPFEPRELLARIKAVLRRTKAQNEPGLGEWSPNGMIAFGAWRLDIATRSLANRRSNTPVRLTAMEFALIKALAEHPNVVLTRDRLINRVHGEGVIVADRAIDVHIARVRSKIEKDPSEPVFIKTVRGKGYVFAGVITAD